MNIAPATRVVRHRTVTLCAVLLAVVLGLGASGCSRSLDMDALHQSIRSGLNDQLALPIASVQCPAGDRALQAGDTFTCTATPTEGGRLTVTVTQKDAEGNVAWEVSETAGLLDLDLVETSVTEGLKAQAQVDAKVSCDGRWKASKPGEVFQCQAETTDGRKATVEVTVTDTEGNISWKVM